MKRNEPGIKDVGEYFDDVEQYLDSHGLTAETVEGDEWFSYERDTQGKLTGRGHLQVRIYFPDHPDAYLHAEDWIRSEKNHLVRDYYAYDLIYKGARLEHWHRHHGSTHKHDEATHEKVPADRTTLIEAVDACLHILWAGKVPDADD